MNFRKLILPFIKYSNATVLVVFFLLSCTDVKNICFETPVDTSTRRVNTQLKQDFNISEIDISASNKFDGARLNGFEKVNDSTVLVRIIPENNPINDSPYYSFKIWSANPKIIYVQFDYPNGFNHRYVPKLKQSNSNKWEILESNNIYKKDGKTIIKLALTEIPLFVSAQEIVTSTDTHNWASSLIKDDNSVSYKIIGKSVLGKDLHVLDIYMGKKKNKPIVVLLTRQHPPEVTGFFAFQKFLETILSGSNLSTDFLNKYRVLAFPILNPDGVDLGYWRHNAGGVDLNRDWSQYRQPEIKYVTQFIVRATKNDNAKIVLGLDFHSTREDVFYTNKTREGTSIPNFIETWFDALEKKIPNYKVNELVADSKNPVSKGWFLYSQKAIGITYEIGDETPRDKIQLLSRVSAEEMMKILINTDY